MNDIWGYTISREADAGTVVLFGELDLSARDSLRDVVTAEVERQGVRAVRVDLAAVSFLDSTIMSVLISAYLLPSWPGPADLAASVGPGSRRSCSTWPRV